MTDKLKRFIALWENVVCEIRAENNAGSRNSNIDLLCTKLESSMVAYAHFTI